jgi:hypothetical protein
MSRLRLRAPSPALVLSFVALIIALGGTSYAAFSLPNGSVGTAQLQNKAVTNAKLGPLSVGTAKIRDGSVTALKMNTSGLTVPGALNANTATTANGLTGIQIVQGPGTTVGPNTQAASTATCPKGMVAIGGNQVNQGFTSVSLNEVIISGAAVTVFLNNTGAASVAWHAYAVCVNGSAVGNSVKTAAEAAK